MSARGGVRVRQRLGPMLSGLRFRHQPRRRGQRQHADCARAHAADDGGARRASARFAAIGALVAEWQPAALVVGVPFHPDGAAHDNTARAGASRRQLHGRFGLPVHEVDERYTTTEALAAGAADVDAASAALILEQFLQPACT